MVNNEHDIINTSKETKRMFKKNKKSGELKNEAICWRYKPIYNLKQVINHNYNSPADLWYMKKS